jgi:hypothetical protein
MHQIVSIFQACQPSSKFTVDLNFPLEIEDHKEKYRIEEILKPIRDLAIKELIIYTNNDYILDDFNSDTFRDYPKWHQTLNLLVMAYFKVKSVDSLTFASFRNLHHLGLRNLGIGEIRLDTFENLEQLQHLDLSFNEVGHIEPGTLDNLANLEELFVTDNQLMSLQPGVFRQLKNLKVLSLTRNPLGVNLHDDVFLGLHSLERLFLSGTPLAKTVDRSSPIIFQHVKNLNNLYL